jgi:hypothetical protein
LTNVYFVGGVLCEEEMKGEELHHPGGGREKGRGIKGQQKDNISIK